MEEGVEGEVVEDSVVAEAVEEMEEGGEVGEGEQGLEEVLAVVTSQEEVEVEGTMVVEVMEEVTVEEVEEGEEGAGMEVEGATTGLVGAGKGAEVEEAMQI